MLNVSIDMVKVLLYIVYFSIYMVTVVLVIDNETKT
jgi:hypothetical protein